MATYFFSVDKCPANLSEIGDLQFSHQKFRRLKISPRDFRRFLFSVHLHFSSVCLIEGNSCHVVNVFGRGSSNWLNLFLFISLYIWKLFSTRIHRVDYKRTIKCSTKFVKVGFNHFNRFYENVFFHSYLVHLCAIIRVMMRVLTRFLFIKWPEIFNHKSLYWQSRVTFKDHRNFAKTKYYCE